MMLWTLPALALVAATQASPVRRDERPKIVPGKYLVQIKPGVDAAALLSHHETVRRLARRDAVDEPIERTFSIGALNAYLGVLDESSIPAIEALDEVLRVVPDEYIYVEKTQEPALAGRALVSQNNSLWSLGDLSHTAPGSTQYVYDESTGEGTTVYVFDTGIRLSHVEFGGRARFGINAILNSTDPSGASNDQDGHGTHCAATAVGAVYGTAKKAQVVDVKVFDGSSGSVSATLTGIQWAVEDVLSRAAQATSVFSMSLSARTESTLLDDAVRAAYDAGILTITAAGNENELIEGTTPARVPEAITVGMTRADRGRANIIPGIYGSNFGPEMDVFAPGQSIVSASHLSDTGNSTKTGTSMATPLVAGLVCYLRALEGGLGSPKAVTDRILELSLKDVVGDPQGSPNRLVNNGSGA